MKKSCLQLELGSLAELSEEKLREADTSSSLQLAFADWLKSFSWADNNFFIAANIERQIIFIIQIYMKIG